MWFEILVILCAGIMLVKVSPDQGVIEYKEKLYAAVLVAAAWFYMALYRKTYSITIMLLGYTAVLLVICVRHLAQITASRLIRGSYLLKVGLVGLLYELAVKQYVPAEGNSRMGTTGMTFAFIAISAVFLFSGRIKQWMENREYYVCFPFLISVIPILSFYIIESIHNEKLEMMQWKYAFGNILWLSFLFAAIYYVLPRKKIAAVFFLTAALAFGLGNYYVNQFRGSPIMPADLMAAGTAFAVMGGYEYQISEPVMTGVLCWYAAIALLGSFPEKRQGKHWKTKAFAGGMAVCVCVCSLVYTSVEDTFEFEYTDVVQCWVNDFYNDVGCVLGFTVFLQNSKIEEPDGYSAQHAETILDEYQKEEAAVTEAPVIIAVMDEAFSDLQVLGDFDCSPEYLKNWYMVDDFSLKGSLYVSTFGGRTANTEFEFLTGNSIASFPAGVVPYQSYDLAGVGNLADILKQYGYAATAVHPENKGNWGRLRAYASMGFDEFLGIDDFHDAKWIRNHISDESSFEKLIALYEQQEGRQFLFNVTMQNHSGYNIEEMSGYELVNLKEEWAGYTDVETYLTLIRESDKAIKELIDYFRDVEEPVMICIFGDHLPMVNEGWIEITFRRFE